MRWKVRCSRPRPPFNAQLVDAESGAHLSAESFDEDRADLLQLEDDIVTRLARTLDFKMNEVEAAEAGRLRRGNLGAQDLALQCQGRVNDNCIDAGDPVKHPELFESANRRCVSISAIPSPSLVSSGDWRD